MFTLNQKVFDYFYGWGVVRKVNNNGTLEVRYDNQDGNIVNYTSDGYILDDDIIKYPTLATKEYTLNGFTQEPQIDWDDYIGKWCVFKDTQDPAYSSIYIDKLVSVDVNGGFHNSDCSWRFCTPLTEEQIKVLNLK